MKIWIFLFFRFNLISNKKNTILSQTIFKQFSNNGAKHIVQREKKDTINLTNSPYNTNFIVISDGIFSLLVLSPSIFRLFPLQHTTLFRTPYTSITPLNNFPTAIRLYYGSLVSTRLSRSLLSTAIHEQREETPLSLSLSVHPFYESAMPHPTRKIRFPRNLSRTTPAALTYSFSLAQSGPYRFSEETWKIHRRASTRGECVEQRREKKKECHLSPRGDHQEMRP